MGRNKDFRIVEVGEGQVFHDAHWKLNLGPIRSGYSNAQIDDYGGNRRKRYPWRAGTLLELEARFSDELQALKGTAGFGFWNAPFGDPSVHWPALPQATWYFFASEPNDLPFALNGPGRGWFAATINSHTLTAITIAPFSPFIVLLNNFTILRRKLWPLLRRILQISYCPVKIKMTDWHHYHLGWTRSGCRFEIDGRLLYETHYSPSGPLGFVCWIDNQYLVATPMGKLRWGVIPTSRAQWLEVRCLKLRSL